MGFEHIGRRLRASRIAAKVSQSELAARASLTQAHVSAVERGADIRLSTLVQLAAALGLVATLVPAHRYELIEEIAEAEIDGRVM